MIALLIDWSGQSVADTQAQRMTSSLGIAQKEGAKAYVDGNIYCGCVDASRAWRPHFNSARQLVLFSGFIDNRDQLSSDLGRKFARDTELYGAAYERWGSAADLKVVGQYSALIVSNDGLAVRASRSPIMAPPLHVWRKSGKLIIASSPRVIFASGEARPEVDEQKIADTLFLNYEEEARSWYKDVSRVPLGSVGEFRADSEDLKHYYNIDRLPQVRFKTDIEYVEAANHLLAEGVRAAVATARKPAILLSGGYDSQAVAAHAFSQDPALSLIGFTGVPEPGWDGRVAKSLMADESPHAEALARIYPGLTIQKVDAAGAHFDDHLQKVFLLSGVAPRNAANFHWIFASYERAKAEGCDVILNGGFGNASFSFSGEGALPDWFRSLQWLRLLRELIATKGRETLFGAFVSKVLLAMLPSDLWRTVRKLRGLELVEPFDSWCPMNQDWAAEMRVSDRASEFGFDPYSRDLVHSTRGWRIAMIERGFSEGADLYLGLDAAYGLKSRDPTAYRPLVEFCLSIPNDQYLRNGQFRWLAKRMLNGMVPDAVLQERRFGRQGADWHYRMGRQRHALRAELERLEADHAMARRFNLTDLKRALDEWPAETPLQDEKNIKTAMRLELAVTRAITTARYIKFVEGTNI